MRLTKNAALAAAEYGFFLIAMLLISDALTPVLYPPGRAQLELGDSNPNRLVLAIATYLISLLLLGPRMKQAMKLLLQRPEILLLMLLPLASIFWSADPLPVARRASAHLLTIIFCLYAATRYSPDEFFERLLVTFWIGMSASILLCIFVPSVGITHGIVNSGSWQGVYGHKAIAGRMCAISLFVALLYAPRTRLLHVIRVTTIALTLLLCAMTQSRASWLLVLFGAGATLVVQLLRTHRLSSGMRMLISAVIVVAMIIAGTAMFNDLLLSMGRDATFSGRTKLWTSAIRVASDHHPWFGAGYRDFWLGPSVGEVQRYLTAWARMPAHGHNGYLDVWLELGWVGLFLLIFFLVRTVAAVLSAAVKQPKSQIWGVFAVCCLIFIVNNISASVALRHTDAAWVFIILASLYTARFQLDAKSISPGHIDELRRARARRVVRPVDESAPVPAWKMQGQP